MSVTRLSSSGPSRSKHCKLKEVISRGFVKSYSTYKINCGNAFC